MNELAELRNKLDRHLNLSELKNIAFDLKLDKDDLGEKKGEFIREMLGYLGRNKRLPELLGYVRKKWPTIEWPDVTGRGGSRYTFRPPEVPGDFVQRPREFNALIRNLLSGEQQNVAITAALRGAG